MIHSHLGKKPLKGNDLVPAFTTKSLCSNLTC